MCAGTPARAGPQGDGNVVATLRACRSRQCDDAGWMRDRTQRSSVAEVTCPSPLRATELRRQRLGTELRRLRERAGLTATQAAKLLGGNQARMSNIGGPLRRQRRVRTHTGLPLRMPRPRPGRRPGRSDGRAQARLVGGVPRHPVQRAPRPGRTRTPRAGRCARPTHPGCRDSCRPPTTLGPSSSRCCRNSLLRSSTDCPSASSGRQSCTATPRPPIGRSATRPPCA
jgi:hypothetical protein